MANKSVFAGSVGRLLPRADRKNREGASAYGYSAEHELVQLAVTGSFNGTFYAAAQEQPRRVLELCAQVEPAFIAKTAIYAREKAHMKDMPAFLIAALTVVAPALAPRAFERVIDNGKMLRTFVQIMRSGEIGRKSLGTMPRRLVRDWLENANEQTLIRASVGQAPSLADVIKMVHPKPANEIRGALYGYFIGRDPKVEMLPTAIQRFETFKVDATAGVPNVPFQLLTAHNLDQAAWVKIARDAGWQMTRMNLNTFARHGVFKEKGMEDVIAKRLRSEVQIKRARVLPYKLMMAYAMAGDRVPGKVRSALQDAMEIATQNVPHLKGNIAVCPDVSGSMRSPITGYRRGSTSAVRCVDVAALFASALMRQNRDVRVLPFEQRVVKVDLNERDSIVTNAAKLAKIGSGGTNCSAPLALLNAERAKVDLVVMVSDNQSWVDASARRGTETMAEWQRLKRTNRDAKLVCIDLQPYGTTQANEQTDVLNVGGFSDAVFETVAAFARGQYGPGYWVQHIKEIAL